MYLNRLFQAKAFLRTSAMNPTSVITLEDITTIFYKMDDFYQIHHEFVSEMNKKVQNWSDDQEIADDVKKLVRIQKVSKAIKIIFCFHFDAKWDPYIITKNVYINIKYYLKVEAL